MASGEKLLDDYRRKRDFGLTAEPSGKGRRKGKRTGDGFVVQMHDATRLHYDFRLELDGVLKSWAVTRGPSLDPGEKRLAVRTEDHPLDYGTFEGAIPKGQYGGGTVMVWDRGTWTTDEDPRRGIEDGKLKFTLAGERLRGGWTLVRMKPKPGEKRENWLLIKEHDAEATEGRDTVLKRNRRSVATGRTLAEIAKGAPVKTPAEKPTKEPRKSSAKAPRLPDWRPPQLATLVDAVPGGEGWLFELKYDGYRCLAAIAGSEVRLFTRKGLDWTNKFGALVAPFATLTGGTALIDGEICAFDEKGRTDFATLKAALSDGGDLVFFAFDLLELDGRSLLREPLSERKARLETLIGKTGRTAPIQLSPTIRGKGEEVRQAVCAAGHEGIIAKRADATYRSERTRTWLKIKCLQRQEFVIAGWSPSDKRRAFASLLLGTWDDGKLIYRGRVGTGFSESDRDEIGRALADRARKTSPFENAPRAIARSAKWTAPELVAEIAFTEFTADGYLRHPSFVGLREDKPAREIAVETPQPDGDIPAAGLDLDAGVAAAEAAGVRLTSPEKVMFPGQGVTKAQLAAYYAAVHERMLPHIADRPLSLVRCPAGRTKHCFFQKHDTGGFPAAMKSLLIAEKDGEKADYFWLDDLAGLLSGVQMGVLEFHLWGARRDLIEKPDRLVFDIDPDTGLGFEAVRDAALDIRDALGGWGLVSYAMVTGGKGVHVIAPLTRRAGWDDVKKFSRAFARELARREPDRFTADLSKARRKGKLFIDYLRNERGATAIAPFSTRAREGAPVAVPMSWEELETLDRANGFGLAEAAARAREPDPWPDYFAHTQSVTRAMVSAVAGDE